jgi:hypothetical protein
MWVVGYVIFPGRSSGFQFDSLAEHIIVGIFLGPLAETLIFQSFIIHYSLKKFKGNKIIAIFLSALSFSLIHHYSLAYIMVTFVFGFLYALLFLILLNKGKNAVLYTTITHSNYNLIALIVNSLT